MATKTEMTILECIAAANSDELQYRIDSLERISDTEASISISQNIEGNELARSKQVVQDNDTIYSVQYQDVSENTISDMEILMVTIKEAIHQSIDTIMPIQLGVFEESLSKKFHDNSLRLELYGVEVIAIATDSILQKSDEVLPDKEKYKAYTFVFDSTNNLGYKVYVESITKIVLYQMSGMLATTILIILILGFAFWYLIKTIMHQKTLDQMKDDFTNNMTHELKTPIAVAYSAADALLNFKQGDNKERRDKYLAICKEQLADLSGRVEQILSMSMERRQTFVLNKEEINISDILDNLIAQFKLRYKKNINFSTHIEPNDLLVKADRTHLSNMLSNLIDNAIKYSGESVNVAIKAYQNDLSYIIEVKDNGVGISVDKKAYIFDKFYRVTHGNKYSVKGYGLGLYYVKMMAEKHGGSVTVSSTVNKGTTFIINLPK